MGCEWITLAKDVFFMAKRRLANYQISYGSFGGVVAAKSVGHAVAIFCRLNAKQKGFMPPMTDHNTGGWEGLSVAFIEYQ
jgi:hypothetical protein